ncbi:hypothetical protein MANES_01G061550v8 [Manihot esculenta]|uniref:Uncharacterized protein n=1 Tax=Manihot esculenta TaxID=3983 RepID=A0ACB7IDX0_MANES|nr:hypothetical protein MANES_01G061550v8 [Manihot esculenta]
MAANNNSTLSLRSILEKDKLKENETNFIDWFRNLRIVLKQEKKSYVLDEAIPEPPLADATNAVKNKHKKHMDDSNDIGCLMLATICPEHQKDLEHLEVYEMSVHLKQTFQQQARQDRYETTIALHDCKMAEDENFARLGYPLSLELFTDMILHSLSSSFSHFVMNYNMNNMEKSIPELHGMLKTVEVNVKKRPTQILNVNKGKPMKNKGKPKSKGGNGPKGRGKPKQQDKAKVPKEIVPKEGICFHCKEPGHWKRNCKLYLDECKKNKSNINLSISTSWVLDTEYGSHICTNVHGLKRSRKLKKGDVDLRVGNGARVVALAVRTYELVLPNGFC